MTQAYLQSKHKFTQNIYIKVKQAHEHLFGLKENELPHLTKPLYGLYDSEDYWGLAVRDHVVDDLGMTPTIGDSALYTKETNGKVDGICGSFVDDTLNAGSDTCERLAEVTLTMFESKSRDYENFDFYGTQIRTIKPGEYEVTETYYINILC